jgi:winged helix DNA-binding protein
VAAPAARTLTQRDLNRALLGRQHLLDRAGGTIPRALERVGGLQAQYAPAMYIGLWSRLERFERDDLTRALERRTVVQGTLMRATIHLVSARDYWPLAVAIGRGRREWWLRVRPERPSPRDLAAAAGRLRRHLADGPLRRAEIDELLGKPGSVVMNGVGLWLDLVRVPPSGTWERRRADLYAAAEDWLGPAGVTPETGVEHLVRRYLGGFGPAPRTDIADWAGLSVRDLTPALDRLRLRRFRGEGGDELLDLPRAPLPDPETPAPVRFLPVWDATLLVHARRTGILPEEHRPTVFNTKTPHSVATFIVDGAVAGTWRYERGRVRLEPFGRLERSTRRELEEEAERLGAFLS